MSRRQDYIARIRYQNELPPPPCPPKLLNIPIDTKKIASSSTFLTNLVRKQPVNIDVDMDLGMPLDLTEVQGIFDRGDESGVYPLSNSSSADHLDPKDRALLRNPAGLSGGSKSQPGVSFLRRTEYISSEAVRQKSIQESKAATILRQRQLQESSNKTLGPEDQLRVVEATFDATAEDLSELRHPKKKNLRAVESFPLFPDTKMFDLGYVTMKMIGSASLSNSKRKFSPESLSTSIFRHVVVGPDQWMSFYTADDETSTKIKSRLDSTEDTVAASADDDQVYRFNRVQDNDIDLHIHKTNLDEIAISFTDDGRALYLPTVGRTSLKRRRVLGHRKEIVSENSIGAIDLSLREITAKESTERDNARAEFDYVSYTITENVEEEDDEEEGEEDGADEEEDK